MNIQFHLAQHKTKYTSIDLIRTSVAEVPEGTYDYNYRDTCLLIRYPTNQTISSSEAHKVLLLYTYIVYIHTLSYVYVCTYNNVDTYIYIVCIYMYTYNYTSINTQVNWVPIPCSPRRSLTIYRQAPSG